MALVRTGGVLLFGLAMDLFLHHLPAKLIVNPNAPGENRTEEETGKTAPKFNLKEYGRNVWRNLEYMGFYLVLGLVLGAAVEVFLPARWIAAAFPPASFWSVFLAALLGVPLYACGGGVIPLIRSFLA
ncbi:MAG: hypothetical protein GX493_00965 [Firmicutes bacterium]|nr:hypothetical protein [Bacillota bacterium]